jgi:hypothetical protein
VPSQEDASTTIREPWLMATLRHGHTLSAPVPEGEQWADGTPDKTHSCRPAAIAQPWILPGAANFRAPLPQRRVQARAPTTVIDRIIEVAKNSTIVRYPGKTAAWRRRATSREWPCASLEPIASSRTEIRLASRWRRQPTGTIEIYIGEGLPVQVFHHKTAVQLLEDQGGGKWRSGIADSPPVSADTVRMQSAGARGRAGKGAACSSLGISLASAE